MIIIKKQVVIIIVLLIFVYFLMNYIGPLREKYFVNKSLTTHTSSTELKTLDEKIDFLERYVTLFSTVYNTEFSIFYQDNSRGLVPGPSDCDMKIAVKIPKESINNWLEGFVEATDGEVKLDWWNDLKLDSSVWAHTSSPKFYKRPNESVYLVVYEEESIILKRIMTY